MEPSTTLTVRLAPKIKKQLGRLAETSQRTRSFLASEAITDYVLRESEIVEGIKRSRADMKAGRVLAHAQVMDEIDALIEDAAKEPV